MTLPLALAYLETHRYADVRRVLTEVPALELPTDYRVERLCLLALASLGAGENDQVDGYLHQILALGEDLPVILDAVASIRKVQGRVEEAKNYL